jgi:hypothetical protein
VALTRLIFGSFRELCAQATRGMHLLPPLFRKLILSAVLAALNTDFGLLLLLLLLVTHFDYAHDINKSTLRL